ncbi:MAG TPA: TetR/AcrR family transcriptional regulator [Trueperaceae bacterium]|jgi:AcrR family transcriptional regulator
MSELPVPSTARGEATRRRLLEAAEAEIGENGYAATSVAAITRRAGVAQGTFYLYFRSKKDALVELVRHMGHSLRAALARATSGAADRLEAERLGFRAFVAFSLEHQNLYKVVMESQFVEESAYREYYQTLADAYAVNLSRAQGRGEVRAGDPAALAWALMGVAHFLGLRFPIWERRPPPDEVMDTVFAFISAGLAPDGRARGDGGPSAGAGTSRGDEAAGPAPAGRRGDGTERPRRRRRTARAGDA